MSDTDAAPSPVGFRRWAPNVLTASRLVAAPIVAIALFATGPGGTGALLWATLAFVVFTTAAVTDWLDGALARAWAAQSRLGATLDLWADKSLVGFSLIALAVLHLTGDGDPTRLWAAMLARPIEAAAASGLFLALTGRDLMMTALRAHAAAHGSTIAPSRLAKVKTALVMGGLGVVIGAIWLASLGFALDLARICYWLGWMMLAAGAALSLWTAWLYIAPRLKAAA